MTKKQQSYLAGLMANALTLMMYQTEREHSASKEQTAFVNALTRASEAATKLQLALAE